MQGITNLDAFLQLIVQLVGQAKRVAFVCFEESFLPLLDMDHENWNIELLQVLEQSAMVMSSYFQKSLNLGEWHIRFDPIDERAKVLSRVLKGEGRAMFKALVAGE